MEINWGRLRSDRPEILRAMECFLSYQEDLARAGESREELRKVFDELLGTFWVAMVCHAPDIRAKYDRWSNEELIAADFCLYNLQRGHLAVILGTKPDDPKVERLLKAVHVDDLVEIYIGNKGDLGAVQYFMEVAADEWIMREVICQRIEEASGVAVALLRCRDLGRQEDLCALEKALSVDRMQSHRPGKYGEDDLRGIATAEAIEAYNRLRAQALKRDVGPFQEMPGSFGGGNDEVLDTIWRQALEAFQEEVVEELAALLPMMEGTTETIPETVRQALRNEFEKWKAQKRSGAELSFASIHDSTPIGVDGNVESATQGQRVSGRVSRRMINWVESVWTRRLQVKEILVCADRKWGERASRFLEGVLEGRSILEAAERAGISRQTGNNYLRELRKTITEYNARVDRVLLFPPTPTPI